MIEKIIAGIIVLIVLAFIFYFFVQGIGVTLGPQQKQEPERTDLNYLLSKLQNGNNTVIVVVNNYNNLTQTN